MWDWIWCEHELVADSVLTRLPRDADWTNTQAKDDVISDEDDSDDGGTLVPNVTGILGYGGANRGAQQIAGATRNSLVYSRKRGDDGAGRQRGRSGG